MTERGDTERASHPAELRARRANAVLVIACEGRLSTHSLPQEGKVALGRGADAEIRVEHSQVSKLHALLKVEPGRITIEDLVSTNGTWVGERAVTPGEPAVVGPGDLVRLGRSACCWLEERTGESALPARPTPAGAEPVVVVSEAMRALHATIERIAPGDINVLVCGETGVGKAVVARAIHERSRRAQGPFLTLDCAGLSESLLESELFGHERGAFTGAIASKPGLLECAQGGTIFLDEVGELPPACQAKLLRPLEEHLVQRVGSVKPLPIDVRFVAATHRDLAQDVAAGRFRRDLFFRLDGFTLTVPPLRQRREEVVPLARAWAAHFAAQQGRPEPSLTPAAVAHLEGHGWPGNVRELRSTVERAVLLCGRAPIEPAHLQLRAIPDAPAPAPESGRPAGPEPDTDMITLRGGGELSEQLRILRALQACGGNQRRAAEMLGISRNTLMRKLDLYGVPRPRLRRGETPPEPEERIPPE